MRIHPSLLRSTLAIALAGAASILAPGAEAQELAVTVGDPVAYRVGLPEGWHRDQEDETLIVVDESEEFMIMVSATDLVADEPLEMPEPDARRFLTTMLMASDSLLLLLLEHGFLNQNEYPITNMVQEIGTLGGERAAQMFANIEADGEEGWFRIHVTVKDGVMYLLAFIGQGDLEPRQEQLMDRIHESFVLADAPPPLNSRPRGGRPGKGSN